MTNIRPIDMQHLEDLFEMRSGYVLDFSNRTFAEFFAGELDVDIDDPAYERMGGSKANRLRTFLQTADKQLVIRALRALWEYREFNRQKYEKPETVRHAEGRLLAIINKLGGTQQDEPKTTPGLAIDRIKFKELRTDLMALRNMKPQPRGYAFEKFLKELFDLHRLDAREPFRLRGEQIDGSFDFNGQTYLLEAKWQDPKSDIGQLHTFHGKLEQKAAWARGLFVSHSGFSLDALHAFGRGKRVVCMDGLDLFDALDREIPFNHVLERKVRRAAETGMAFVMVRDLF